MSALRDIVTAEAGRDTFPAAKAFAVELRRFYGTGTAGILFYGSCLRENTDTGLMLDFYVLVDRYRPALQNPVSALFAAMLPPNVYYHELAFEGRTLRAKVAVMSLADFIRGTGAVFVPSLWARFAQPTRILFARNVEIARRLVNALTSAIQTTIARTLPLMTMTFTARELWLRAFAESYGAELRPEQEAKRAALVEEDLVRYDGVTAAVLGPASDGGKYPPTATSVERTNALLAWRGRRILGKTLNVLRLIKAAFTFSGGVDYAAWKIERHSGVKIALTDAERRRPLLTGLRLFLETLKRGGIR